MKTIMLVATLALALSTGYAAAQTTRAPALPNPDATKQAPRAGSYWGTDTEGTRVHVQAPYGGKSQVQADAKEVPLTERLNRQSLEGTTTAR